MRRRRLRVERTADYTSFSIPDGVKAAPRCGGAAIPLPEQQRRLWNRHMDSPSSAAPASMSLGIYLCCMSYGGSNRGNHAWSLGEEETWPFILGDDIGEPRRAVRRASRMWLGPSRVLAE